jgi:4-hydroxy-4-methyl-2-oxoglutarate aldolase
MTPDRLMDRLRRLDTCAVSDAMDQHGISGVAPGIGRQVTRKTIAGRAVTVELGPDPEQGRDRRFGVSAVEAAAGGDVLVIANGGRSDVAVWGGLLSLNASLRGIAGVVIDGACRDIQQSADQDFPVFARSVVPAGARGRLTETSINETVHVGDCVVRPGDLVLGDDSGVVFVPAARAEQVIATAEEIAKRDEEREKALRASRPSVAGTGGPHGLS